MIPCENCRLLHRQIVNTIIDRLTACMIDVADNQSGSLEEVGRLAALRNEISNATRQFTEVAK